MSRSHKINHRVIGNDYPNYYRKPKSTQERRVACSEEHKPYIRGKRSFCNLPNAWNDRPKSQINPKSWKKLTKSKYQSQVEKRGKQKSIYLPEDKDFRIHWQFSARMKVYNFKEYCKKHSIPCKVVERKKSRVSYYDERIFVPNGKMKHYYSEPRYKDGILIAPRRITYSYQDGDWVFTGKKKAHKYKEIVGYNLIWWSDKNIGIDRILADYS